jgi:putative flippase GtrA
MSTVSPYDRARARLEDAWRRRTLSLKAISFALIGVVNTAVEYCIFLLARAALDHSAAALSLFGALADRCHCGAPTTLLLIVSNMISWSIAISGSYVMNSTITFAAESGRKLSRRHYIIFIVSGIAGLIANTAALVFVAQILLFPVWLAKAAAILASFVVNFSMSHFVVFRVRSGPAGDAGEGG